MKCWGCGSWQGEPSGNLYESELCETRQDYHYLKAIVARAQDAAAEMKARAEKAEAELQALKKKVAAAWQEGYEQGVADERTAEANIGIAGLGGKVHPARTNPYQGEEK